MPTDGTGRRPDVLSEGALPDWIDPYVASLVDNHFSFTITIGKDSKRKIGFRIQQNLRYKAEGDQVIHLLERYCDQIGVSPRITEKPETKYPHYEFVISRRNDVDTFLSKLRPYVLIQEEAVTILLDRILPALERNAHSEKESFIGLMADIEEFRTEVGRANRAKYDYDYFIEEWDM